MTQTRFNGLALLHVHQEIDVNTEEVLDIFARRHSRRMQMLNILDSNKDVEQDDNEWLVKFSLALHSFDNNIVYKNTQAQNRPKNIIRILLSYI